MIEITTKDKDWNKFQFLLAGVSNDENRSYLHGIHEDNLNLITTDGRVLHVLYKKNLSPNSLFYFSQEKDTDYRIVSKKPLLILDTINEYTFPNYNQVIPSWYTEEKSKYKIAEYVASVHRTKKEAQNYNIGNWYSQIRIMGDMIFRFNLIEPVLEFDHIIYGIPDLARTPIVCEFSFGFALIMPTIS